MLPRIAYIFKDFFPYLVGIFTTVLLFFFFLIWLLRSSLRLTAKKLLLAFAFCILSFALILSIFEGYFRYVYDESDGLGFLQVNKRWYQRHVVYNNYFKRDRDFEVKKTNGEVRIAAFGDSITFGQGVANPEDRFSNILQRKLRESDINVQVYNLGVPGLDSHEEINVYNDLSTLNFDIIVWQYYLNDIQGEDKSEPAEIISRNAYSNDLVRQLTTHSTFFDFVYWRFSSKYATTFSQLDTHYLSMYSNESTLKNHEEELTAYINKLKEQNKKIIVVIFPFIELVGPSYPAVDAHSKLKAYFNSQNIEVIDLLDDLKNSNWKDLIASKFDTHPNERIHLLAAEKLYEKLYTLLTM